MTPDSFVAPSLEELAPLFPNYSIDAFIAQGGMGAVYLGSQLSLDRPVAIKILPRHLGADEEFRSSFQAEARSMAKLNHPSLIGVYDFGEVDGMPFIVMEYVPGKSLHDSSYGRQIDPAEAARIVAAICQGLQHAHEHDILHRDVKPANILLDQEANPKLGDFGLAMTASGDSDGLIYGTPGYAAPEVYAGKPDHRSDIYAAGVMLYEMLCGAMPSQPYRNPSQVVSCDRRFDTLLVKALQPDVKNRHQSASEFAEQLEAIINSPVAAPLAAPLPAFATTSRPQLASASKSSSMPLVLGVAAVAAIGAIAVFAIPKKDKPSTTPSVTASPTNETLSSEDTAPTDPIPANNANEISQAEKAAQKAEQQKAEEERLAEAARQEEERLEEERLAAEELKKERRERRMAKNSAQETEETTEKVPVSTYDHVGFLKRGRDFCRQGASRALAEHSEDLLKNIDKLEREGRSILRDQSYLDRDTERARKELLQATIEVYKAAGRLPANFIEEPSEALTGLGFRSSEVELAMREAMDEQSIIDNKFKAEILPLQTQYVTGVRKQAENLRQEGNEYDASILENEASTTEGDLDRFIGILEGEEPIPEGLPGVPGEQSGTDAILGKWAYASSENYLNFKDDGSVQSRRPRMKGTYETEDDTILILWNNDETSRIKVADTNPSYADYLDEATDQRFRLIKMPSSPSAMNDVSESELAADPMVGRWNLTINEKVIFTFKPDGTARSGVWGGSGTWKPTATGACISWGGNAWIEFVKVDDDTMKSISGKGDIRTFVRMSS